MAPVTIPSYRGDADGGVTVLRDQIFAAQGGHTLFADVHLPEAVAGPVPAILWLSSGCMAVAGVPEAGGSVPICRAPSRRAALRWSRSTIA
jgi:hypothetical protein